jgi:hypothetical protein
MREWGSSSLLSVLSAILGRVSEDKFCFFFFLKSTQGRSVQSLNLLGNKILTYMIEAKPWRMKKVIAPATTFEVCLGVYFLASIHASGTQGAASTGVASGVSVRQRERGTKEPAVHYSLSCGLAELSLHLVNFFEGRGALRFSEGRSIDSDSSQSAFEMLYSYL